jgi:hypothetical protein
MQNTAADCLHYQSYYSCTLFSVRTTVALFVLDLGTAHKNQQYDVVWCINFAKCTVCSLLPLFSPKT